MQKGEITMKKSLKQIARILVLVMCVSTIASCLFACTKPDEDDRYKDLVKLTIDAGGQNAQYNTTSSMDYDPFLNPYPYNTLEKLVDEWNAANAEKYGYYFAVADNSINMDRETMAPMLSNGSAPEILYYLGTTIAEDQSKGWFYDISSAMETPNKYSKPGEAGSAMWKDIYDSTSYASTFAPNGEKYTVEMEQNPIGIIYNKTLFEAAGITTMPVTYKDFMEAQDKLNAYISYLRNAQFAPYFPNMEFTYAVIDIHFLHGITPKCQQFLKVVQQSVGEMGIQISVSLTKPADETLKS